MGVIGTLPSLPLSGPFMRDVRWAGLEPPAPHTGPLHEHMAGSWAWAPRPSSSLRGKTHGAPGELVQGCQEIPVVYLESQCRVIR